MTSYSYNIWKLLHTNLAKNKVEIVTTGSLDENSERYLGNVVGFKKPLKDHQLTMVKACLDLEATTFNPSKKCDNISYQSNFGIIGDNVGSGKSISVLALIAVKPKLDIYTFPDNYVFTNHMGIITYNQKKNAHIIDTNLIIVPHSIINQWKKYLDDYTSLKYMKINTTKSAKELKEEDINASTVILLSNNFINEFIERVEELCTLNQRKFSSTYFARLFIDESDNIKLSQKTDFKALMTWFITSSIENLLFPNGTYYNLDENTSGTNTYSSMVTVKGLRSKNMVRTLFNELASSDSINLSKILKYIYLKNTNSYIDSSFKIPLPNVYLHKCKSPIVLSLFNSNAPANFLANIKMEDIMTHINANDIAGLKESLGFKVESMDSITDMITQKLNTKLENERIHHKYLQEINVANKAERLEKSQNKINELEESLKYVMDRIDLNKEQMCPICHDTLNEPICTLPCCAQLFCLECLTSYYDFNRKKSQKDACPCCRTNMSMDEFRIIDKENKLGKKDYGKSKDVVIEKPKPAELLSKDNMFIKLLQENGDNKKWLIFSGCDASFHNIINRLSSMDISYSKVQGTVGHIEKVIGEFREGKIKVLLLNAHNFGMGLNLEMATDVLIYHTLDIELEKQVIGRAQRPGRVGVLNIHYLCHENEYETYVKKVEKQQPNNKILVI